MRVFLLVVAVVAAGCGNVKESLVERAIADLREEAGLVERTTVLDGRTVAYLERPGAEPTVVLVHGFGAQKDAWIRFAEAYPEGQRLVVPDLAGHGDSVRDPDATYDTQRLTAELSALLDVVAPDRIDVAGNSLGGAIAARLALVRPQVRRLVLLDPAGVRGPTPTPLDTLLAQGESALVPTTRAEFDRLVDLAFVSDPEIPGIARDVLTADYVQRAPFLEELFRTIARENDALRTRLGDIRQRTLLVWGAEDQILSPSAIPIWEAGLPDVTTRVLPDVGHAPMQERPAETARLVADFLSSDG